MKLIITISKSGNCEELMSAAREAGATGGTILNARGTSTEEDATFFGIHLTPEKEILLIVADTENAQNIVSAIKNSPALKEQGAGIVFMLNAEEV